MNTKKIINYVVLLMMLVVFPFLSWLYLKNGYEYRRQNIQELSGNQPLYLPETLDTSLVNIFGKTSLVITTVDTLMTTNLFRQFKDAPTFQLISDYKAGEFQSQKNWILLSDSVFSSFVKLNDIQVAALIDTAGKIRKKYSLDEKDYIKSVVVHTASLLPFTK